MDGDADDAAGASAVPGGAGRDRSASDKLREDIARTRIAPDLLMKEFGPKTARGADVGTYDVIVEVNSLFPGGSRAAQQQFINACHKGGRSVVARPKRASRVLGEGESFKILLKGAERVDVWKSLCTDSYVFARLSWGTIARLSELELTVGTATFPLVYKIWLDHEIERCVYTSERTVKCDAARAAFAAAGKGIVWAVADTGIDGAHPHFKTHQTLTELPAGLAHQDFTQEGAGPAESAAAALTDTDGHGTHVAGIIAGETRPDPETLPGGIVINRDVRGPGGGLATIPETFEAPISGLAPLCKLVSLKVLTKKSSGKLSSLMAAITYVQRTNDYGRMIKIHGLNLSLGYAFDPTWFAAGQSPLCAEVDRLVKSGVLVVTAAGNGGYGTVTTQSGREEVASHVGTINDPGNALLAVTVGSTHREWPHTYGVSYFSGKGPTGDGRMKPDLVAPGERIVSCSIDTKPGPATARFREDSGTSMAAPHVSGVAAAFISVRTEFQGRPERVKEILMASATDLKRRPEYQGAGLVDVMRALQSV